MRTVRDEAGDRYLLLKESDGASLVQDPETGTREYVDSDCLTPAEGAAPLAVASAAAPDAVRRLVTAVPDAQTLGLLVLLEVQGPVAVRDLLGATEFCESDLHGRLAELRAAGLVEERAVAGERGYGLTEDGEAAVGAVAGD